jgi:CRISPR-associated protein Csc3
VGKRFEDGKYRYLYFYPTYYFTPETNNFLQQAYTQIAQTRFDTSIRNHFISKELNADFSRDRYQTIDAFVINENLHIQTQLPDDDPNHKTDRTFKLSYPDDKPLTFYFMALPPGRDPTDTESWVMPTWLALAFPLILDVKTVVSESPIPPYRDGSEFEETVFLDSAPQAFRVLTQGDHFRLDYLLEGWSDINGKEHPAPLNVLTAAYSIHLDVNAKRGKTGYDANWGKLTELASNLETSPLYVFHYLKQWTRGKDTDIPSISRIKLYTYDFYPCFDPYVIHIDKNMEKFNLNKKSALNHPLNLTLMYRKFYKANKQFAPKSNAVLKPIECAAKAILDADLSFQGSTLHDSLLDIEPAYQGEGMVAMVAAELNKLMDRVHSSNAEGRWVFNDQQRTQEREAILAFAQYFVVEVFEKSFEGDRARLAGRQLNLLRDTCEFLYRLEQDKENRENPPKDKKTNEEESDES